MPPEPAEFGTAPQARLGLARSSPKATPDDLGSGLDTASLRLRIYGVAFGIAFGLYLLVQGPQQGTAFWGLAIAGTAGLLWGSGGHPRILRASVIGCLVLALAVPLVPEMASGWSMEAILRASPPWPQTLVALFASRVLSEECDIRFARFWRQPLRPQAPVGLQSSPAALALGCFLTLLFYQTIWGLIPSRSKETDFAAIVLNALTGETIIHRGIVLLFFVIIGHLIDAALLHRRDRAIFEQVQAAMRGRAERGERGGLQELRVLLASQFRHVSHTRTVHLLEAACDQVAADVPAERLLAAASFSAFHSGARRFLRGLLPFLPMLGFFGTVVGLATAMAALPTSSPEGAGVDISGSLSGLAVKFQTTLLGIMASLFAAGLLAFLERGETELAAECALLVARIDDGA